MYLFKNQLIKLFYLSLVIIAAQSCTTKKSVEITDTVSTSNVQTDESVVKTGNSTPSEIVELVLNSAKGDRASNIGKKMDEVFASETIEATDSASNYKVFSQYFNNSDSEFVDIQYFHQNEIITALQMDVFLNTETDVQLLFDGMAVEFSKKYGKTKRTLKANTWNLKNGFELVLKDVSVKLAPGLQIVFAKKGEKLDV